MSVEALLERLGPRVFQHAWVVEDLAEAEEGMRTAFGCESFVEFTLEQEWELRGRTVTCALATAFTRRGNVQIELMQPLRGEGVQQEFLERYGPGPHHWGIRVEDLDAELAAAAAAGFEPVMTG